MPGTGTSPRWPWPGSTGSSKSKAVPSSGSGHVLRTKGKLADAVAHLERAVPLLREKGTPDNLACAYAALAECSARQARLTEAGRLVREARKAHKGPDDLPQVLRAEAWLLKAQGEPGAAVATLKRAMEDRKLEDTEHKEEMKRLLSAWTAGG